jgi:ParB family chromosome partitioning protein
MNTTAVMPTFQTLPLSLLHESTTNPRRTFDETKLIELADSIRTHGLIQPITVRPHGEGYEIVAGARRFRASLLAEVPEVPVCIKELDDRAALEVQIIENAQRADVHPYEEASGYKRLLDLPGYDVAAIAEKCGKSESHIYARLSLLSLIEEVADAFQQDKITASHANQIARLPEAHQADALKACFRADWQDKNEPHLLPVRNLTTWIQSNVFIILNAAPFKLDDDTLIEGVPSCLNCPKRSGFNTKLFADVEGDQCLDGDCFQSKITAHVQATVAARPELVQIATNYRREDVPGVLAMGSYNSTNRNKGEDKKPQTCKHTHEAIIAFGEGAGTLTSVCTSLECKIHGFHHNYQLTPEQIAAQKQRAKEEKAREKQRKQRRETFERIMANFPAKLNADDFRFLLRALVWSDQYNVFDDAASFYAEQSGERNEQDASEVLDGVISTSTTEQLPAVVARLALTDHIRLPQEGLIDFLALAAERFLPKEEPAAKKPTRKAPAKKAAAKKATAKKASR